MAVRWFAMAGVVGLLGLLATLAPFRSGARVDRPPRTGEPVETPSDIPRSGDSLGDVSKLGLDAVHFPGPVGAVTYSADGKTLIAGGKDSWLELQDLASGERLYFDDFGPVRAVAAHPAGGWLYTATHMAETIGRVCSYSIGEEEIELQAGFSHFFQDILHMALSADGRRAVGCYEKGRVWLFEGRTEGGYVSPGRVLEWPAMRPLHAGFSPDGNRVAVIGDGGRVQIWETETGESIRHLEVAETDGASVAFLDDRRLLTTGGADGSILCWDLEEGVVEFRLEGEEALGELLLSRDGKHLVSRGRGFLWPDAVLLWDLGARRVERRVEVSASCYAFSPDGQTLAVGLGDAVRFWDLTESGSGR